MDIISMVKSAQTRGASDLHLAISSRPVIRIAGDLYTLNEYQPVTEDDINKAFRQLASDTEINTFNEQLELDFSQTLSNVGRIRCNVNKQNNSTNLTIRLVPSKIPTIEELGLPDICKELILRPRGLVVVSGPTGSGKSTTLSAMINYLNQVERRRIVTIEDPVEYIYSNEKSLITQREVGQDTHSFTGALRHVLRQDPDVILIGEMRDYETAATALTVAETGHLVLTTGHATGAAQAVERIVNLFPYEERPLAQARLASFLIAVLCQILVPRANEAGRVPAVEVMVACPAVTNTIREGRLFQLHNAIMTHAKLGMILLDNALTRLYKRGLITNETMFTFCNDPEEINKLLAMSSTYVTS